MAPISRWYLGRDHGWSIAPDYRQLGLFDDPILGNDALDRLANANYQIVTEGQCCRERLSTHKALLDRREVVNPQTAG